jgi:hypothetical protein
MFLERFLLVAFAYTTIHAATWYVRYLCTQLCTFVIFRYGAKSFVKSKLNLNTNPVFSQEIFNKCSF